MAEKSFGIKELNIIGSSGTPQIQSVENLNIKVGIGSTVIIGDSNSNCTIASHLSVSGFSTYIVVATYKNDVFIDGTLTAGVIDGGTY